MAGDINDVTIQYEEDGQELVKELDKIVLSKGAWSTVIFRYQQWENGKGEFSKDRYTIRRYRKVSDEYRQQSKFNISSADQAQKLIDALKQWI
jgi:hypothetical protein